MSTRSSITVKKDDKYATIYCHFDGYVSGGVGEMLQDCYNSQELAESIINQGDCSSLEETIFASTFYARDRDEDGVEARIYDNPWQEKQEYNYLWNGKRWFVAHGSDKPITIKQYLKQNKD